MSIFLALFHSLKQGDTILIRKQDVASHFSRYAKYAQGRTLDQLIADYATNKEKVPIVVSVKDKLIVDRMTLLYFAVYLHGRYTELNRRTSGTDDISEMKKRAADVFESKVRNELLKHGYFSPDSAVKVKYEYDVLGISESKRLILVVDAKFRDMSPSSISASTLVQQELLAPGQGLRDEAERQIARVDYLKKNIGLFKQHLNTKGDPKGYEVRSLGGVLDTPQLAAGRKAAPAVSPVGTSKMPRSLLRGASLLVTKHTPLIKKYKDVQVLSLEQFIGQELK